MSARTTGVARLAVLGVLSLGRGVHVEGVRIHRHRLDASAALGASLGELAGRHVGRYRLLQEVRAGPLEAEGQAEKRSPCVAPRGNVERNADMGLSLVEETMDLVPPDTFKRLKSGYRMGDMLGKGSFGATYLAERTRCKKCKKEHELVAIKFVYRKKKDGQIRLANGKDTDAKVKKAMKAMVSECKVIRSLHANRLIDPEGANKLITCHEACCSTCSGCKTPPWAPVYIVMDYGGDDGDVWYKKNKNDNTAVADVLNQVLQGVNYMAQLDPPVIHHDLKYGNIAVMESRRRQVTRTVKLIDLGAALRVRYTWSKELAVATEWYEPPESHYGFAYKLPPHSFDTWSVGIMALEGLCGLESSSEMKKIRHSSWKEYNNTQPGLLVKVINELEVSPGNRSCIKSILPIIHPVAEKRPEPANIRFHERGARLALGSTNRLGLGAAPAGALGATQGTPRESSRLVGSAPGSFMHGGAYSPT